jgi:prepilin-type N-terminal cleavage/methylation domain-containing protein
MWQIRNNQARRSRERGDTLVEVLVAIVIVATVIGGAYAVSNRSLQSTRGAQERSTALKLGEAQLEQLKSLVTTDDQQIFGATVPTKFCLGNDVTGVHVYNTAIPAEKAKCTVDANGVQTTIQPAYTFEITRTGNDFKLLETWIDISGKFSNSLQLNYRLYEK